MNRLPTSVRHSRSVQRLLKTAFCLAILVVTSTGHRPVAGVRNAIELLSGGKTVKVLIVHTIGA